jgi:hypothetical protein
LSLKPILKNLGYALRRWDAGAWWRAGMQREVLSLYAPDGNITPNPSMAFMEEFLNHGEEYWGDIDMAVLEWLLHKKASISINVLEHRPALYFFFQEPHGYFFCFRAADGTELMPENKTKDASTVTRSMGGEDSEFPSVGFVSREVAGEIVREFLMSNSRSEITPWVEGKLVGFRLSG